MDLSKLTNILKIDIVKKTEYDELVKNVNAIQLLIIVIQSKKLTVTQKLTKLKRKVLIMVMINILLRKNLIR